MIVLHDRRLVFVRTRKTAGTSMEIALSRHARGGDIITALSPRDERLRAACGGHPPRNHLTGGQHSPGPIVAPGPGPGIRFYNHMPAEDIRAELGRITWERYTTIAVERNPFDKVVSRYFHLHRAQPRHHTLSDCIAAGHCLDVRNRPLYTAGGKVIVDLLLAYETLNSDLAAVCARVGLPILELPHAKAQFRPTHTRYRDLLTSAERTRIEHVFADELTAGAYAW